MPIDQRSFNEPTATAHANGFTPTPQEKALNEHVSLKCNHFYIGSRGIPERMMKEEVLHVPKTTQQERHHHTLVEQIPDIHVQHEREEIVHVPKRIPQGRIEHQPVYQIADGMFQ